MLVEVAGGVRVVVTAVHSEGATTAVSLRIILLWVLIASMSWNLLLVSQMLLAVVSEGLSTSTELHVIQRKFGSNSRKPSRVSTTIVAFVHTAGIILLILRVIVVRTFSEIFDSFHLVLFLRSEIRVYYCLEWLLSLVRQLRVVVLVILSSICLRRFSAEVFRLCLMLLLSCRCCSLCLELILILAKVDVGGKAPLSSRR